MAKPRIGLVGFFGWGNFGDELFLLAHKRFLSDVCEPVRLNDLTQRPYFSRPLPELVKEFDGFVIGGGDLIIPWHMSHLYFRNRYLERPVFVAGVGVPTWQSGDAEVIKAYRRFFRSSSVKMIMARDPESVAWITGNLAPRVPVDFFPDLVCALDLPSVEPDPEPTFGVVLRHRRDSEDDFSKVRALCDRAEASGYRIKHIVLGTAAVGANDLIVANRFRKPGEEVVHSEDILDLCSAIGRCHALASMKFHGTVVATMYSVPSISLSLTDKNQNFLKLVGRPELIGGFNAADLPQRFAHVLIPIESTVPPKLKSGAARCYRALSDSIACL